MAKLFNKIRKQLVSEKPSLTRTTNYLKYAFGEIILVVIGILIALSINNWNQQRKNKNAEIKLIAQLVEDAKADAIFFNSRVQFQKVRDTLINRVVALSKGSLTDTIINLKLNLFPNQLFASLLAHQSNLVNNNPDAYDLISDQKIKTKIRKYYSAYDYVKSSIELYNRVNEQYGLPFWITYYNEISKMNTSNPVIGDLAFMINDQKTMATLIMFKNIGWNYASQIENFLIVNRELTELLTNYLDKNQ